MIKFIRLFPSRLRHDFRHAFFHASLRLLLALGLILGALPLPQFTPIAYANSDTIAAGESLVTTTSLLNVRSDGACSLRGHARLPSCNGRMALPRRHNEVHGLRRPHDHHL